MKLHACAVGQRVYVREVRKVGSITMVGRIIKAYPKGYVQVNFDNDDNMIWLGDPDNYAVQLMWQPVLVPDGQQNMSHAFKIYLDDERELPAHMIQEGGWVVARTPPEFFALIEDGLVHVEGISFDNDLGAGWQEGYDLLCHIEALVREHGEPCPKLWAHTMNPPAMKKMYDCIRGLERDYQK